MAPPKPDVQMSAVKTSPYHYTWAPWHHPSSLGVPLQPLPSSPPCCLVSGMVFGSGGVPDSNRPAENFLSFSVSFQRSSCTWMGATADGGGRLCPPVGQQCQPKVFGYGDAVLQLIYVGSHMQCGQPELVN